MPLSNDLCMFYFAKGILSDVGGNNVMLADLRLQLTNKQVYRNCHINFAHNFTWAEKLCHAEVISCFVAQGHDAQKGN